MASKGQKFKRYDQDTKDDILKQLQKGVSSYYLSKKYDIPSRTIQNWKRKFINHPELYLNQGKKGRQKSPVTLEDYKERYEILKKYQAFLKAQRERK